MPDFLQRDTPSNQPSPHRYVIQRKGSFYNITGPNGRIFRKSQSARIAGPRWEELTHNPWPYPSSAYDPGLRLWQLGLINREQVGQREAIPERSPITSRRQRSTRPRTARSDWRPVPILQLFLLPAPRIDRQEQERLMQALRQDPTLLFDPAVHEALRQEVEYHLPQARWAAHLLKLLDCFERRQRRRRMSLVSERMITARHVAWQEQQFATVQ